MKYPILLVFVLATMYCVAVNADAPTGKDEPKTGSPNKGGQVFAARVEAEQKAAQEALLAGKGDAAALDRLKKSADLGDAYAQFHLGLLYKDGKGVSPSVTEYASWLRKSAEQGYVGAQVRLIGIYEKGEGAPKDLTEAAKWARSAAEQGDPAGVSAMAMDYYYGRGVPRDYVQATKWYTVAVELGSASDSGSFFEELKRRAGPTQFSQGNALARDWLAAFHAER